MAPSETGSAVRSKSRSPLVARPLRLPGQSVQEELDRTLEDEFLPYLLAAGVLFSAAAMEWVATWRHIPRQPWLYSALAAIAILLCVRQFFQIRRRVERLKQGRDGEQAVGQFLERLRKDSAHVFHDVVGSGFNLDHIVLSPRGFFVIETKTWSKPAKGEARITLDNGSLQVNGNVPDRDPLVQVRAGARWLAALLQESCGKQFAVRSVVLFPGWFVEKMTVDWKTDLPWVLEPKAFPSFLRHEPVRYRMEDVYLAASHLSRYVRSLQAENTGRR
jgi:Nuclease-related domain